eukprot:gnl/Chilomastix_caulleri/5307.p1 GENE.gnl/Chilomastix_caulleri/5307~~gnl/Chilomastix_caulleri/5307.p1  ORF type:complete len:122 (+),score=34.97 gnl/Chilomastix_caulleri/5307:106-471(+)
MARHTQTSKFILPNSNVTIYHQQTQEEDFKITIGGGDNLSRYCHCENELMNGEDSIAVVCTCDNHRAKADQLLETIIWAPTQNTISISNKKGKVEVFGEHEYEYEYSYNNTPNRTIHEHCV